MGHEYQATIRVERKTVEKALKLARQASGGWCKVKSGRWPTLKALEAGEEFTLVMLKPLPGERYERKLDLEIIKEGLQLFARKGFGEFSNFSLRWGICSVQRDQEHADALLQYAINGELREECYTQ